MELEGKLGVVRSIANRLLGREPPGLNGLSVRL